MYSFADLGRTLANQPPRIGALLRTINRGQGRQELFAEQVPQVLKSLAETTRIASIQASTAIEGYDVSDQRARHIVDDQDAGHFRNRNEKEFAGYRDAMDRITTAGELEPLTLSYPFRLATDLNRYSTGEPGRVKLTNNQIIQRDEHGVSRLIFTPVEKDLVESTLQQLTIGYNDALASNAADPALLIGLYALDFLAIHPVIDGNGRLSRLLTVHELLRQDYEVPRYVSLEQMIFESKNSYYAALEASQRGWHEAQHDPWPWLTYFTTVLADAYETFERRVNENRPVHGSKADRVRHWALNEAPQRFRFQDAVDALPGISAATIRNGLNDLRQQGCFTVERGRDAMWTRLQAKAAVEDAVQKSVRLTPIEGERTFREHSSATATTPEAGHRGR